MGQVALTVVVIVGMGLMIQSFRALTVAPLGFEPRGVLTLRLALPRGQYADGVAVREFYRMLEERVKSLPGVTAFAASSRMVLSGAGPLQTFAYDEETARNWESATADWREISPGFFKALGSVMVAGREFDEGDSGLGAPRRLVIDTALARRAFPGRSGVGERLQIDPDGGPNSLAEVVGVVSPLSLQSIGGSVMPQMYQPGSYSRLRTSVMIRTTGDPKELIGPVGREIRALSRDAAIQEVLTMDDVVSKALLPTRLAATLMSVFGLVSLALAGLGIYAALGYSVNQRVRELGIRMALGETPRGLRASVLSHGLRLVAGSVVLGLAASAVLSRLAQISFHGISWADPWAYLGTVPILGAVAVAAAWIPASRAAQVDPLKALRHE